MKFRYSNWYACNNHCSFAMQIQYKVVRILCMHLLPRHFSRKQDLSRRACVRDRRCE